MNQDLGFFAGFQSLSIRFPFSLQFSLNITRPSHIRSKFCNLLPPLLSMSTPDGSSRKSTSGGTPKPLKHGSGLGILRESLEPLSAYSEVLNEDVATLDPKYINYKSTSGQVPRDLITICTREPPHFKAVDALRKKLRLEPSVPLDVEVKSDDLEYKNVRDNEDIRDSMAERFRVFDGFHSPPLVTEGNVAVPILDGGELRFELEKHEASVTE